MVPDHQGLKFKTETLNLIQYAIGSQCSILNNPKGVFIALFMLVLSYSEKAEKEQPLAVQLSESNEDISRTIEKLKTFI